MRTKYKFLVKMLYKLIALRLLEHLVFCVCFKPICGRFILYTSPCPITILNMCIHLKVYFLSYFKKIKNKIFFVNINY